MTWAMSAPSKRSRRVTKSLEAISSSGASTLTGTPKKSEGYAAIDPGLIDHNDGIAHAGDQVNVEFAAMRLGQPHRVGNFGFEAFFLQRAQGVGDMLGGKKEVQILGVATDAGVQLQRGRAGDDVRDLGVVQVLKNGAEQLHLLRRELRRRRGTDRQRFLVCAWHRALDGTGGDASCGRMLKNQGPGGRQAGDFAAVAMRGSASKISGIWRRRIHGRDRRPAAEALQPG